MKKLFITVLAAIAIGTSAFAAPSTSMSTKVTDHFTAAFAKAKEITWNSDYQFDKISFVLDNTKVDAFYGADGDLIGTTQPMQFDKLPKAAIETITTKYTFPEFQVVDCIQFSNADNEKDYYVTMSKKNENLLLKIKPAGMVRVFSRTKK